MKSITIFRQGSHAVVIEGQEVKANLCYVVSLAYKTRTKPKFSSHIFLAYSGTEQNSFQKEEPEAGKMAQLLRALTALPEDL